MSEKRKIIMAVTQMLDLGTLDERSSQLLEQLADYIRRPPTEAARETVWQGGGHTAGCPPKGGVNGG
jgi:hypothetical protein